MICPPQNTVEQRIVQAPGAENNCIRVLRVRFDMRTSRSFSCLEKLVAPESAKLNSSIPSIPAAVQLNGS